MGKTIGLVSLKGGVGKTTTTVALGTAIADLGKKVLLVDANFSAPNLGLHLNLINPTISLQQVLEKKAYLHQAVISLGNLDVLPCSVFGKFDINPLKLKEILALIKRNYDYILIDSSPALNDETLGAMIASDEIIIVTTPDIPTLSTTMKAVTIAKRRGIKVSGIILNKVYNKKFELPLSKIEESVDANVLAVIPHDLKIPEALSKFASYVNFTPKSKGSVEYLKLAETLTGERKISKVKRFLRFVKNPSKQEINRELFYKSVFN